MGLFSYFKKVIFRDKLLCVWNWQVYTYVHSYVFDEGGTREPAYYAKWGRNGKRIDGYVAE